MSIVQAQADNFKSQMMARIDIVLEPYWSNIRLDITKLKKVVRILIEGVDIAPCHLLAMPSLEALMVGVESLVPNFNTHTQDVDNIDINKGVITWSLER